MAEQLTREDCEYLLECLKHTRLAYEGTQFPSNQAKQQQLARLYAVVRKLRGLRGRLAR